MEKNRLFFLDNIKNMLINYPQYSDIINKILNNNNKKYIIIDTETTGLPITCSHDTFYHYTDLDKYSHARLIQISWGVYSNGKLEDFRDYLIKPKGFIIQNSHIHHITMDMVKKQGIDIKLALQYLRDDLKRVNYVVGHNIKFDYNIICSELFRIKDLETLNLMEKKNLICTLASSRVLKKTGQLKSLKLINLHKFLTGKGDGFQPVACWKKPPLSPRCSFQSLLMTGTRFQFKRSPVAMLVGHEKKVRKSSWPSCL